MKKLLLLALLLMPTMTLARANNFVDLPREANINPIVEPTPAPTPEVLGGGGGMNPAMFMPMVSSPVFMTPWFGEGTYQFLTTQFGFAYFESITGERIYEMDYATYHTIDTKGAGTIYFIQIDKNGFEHPVLKVLEIE